MTWKLLERCVRTLACREKEIEVLNHCILQWKHRAITGVTLFLKKPEKEEDEELTDKSLLNPLFPTQADC